MEEDQSHYSEMVYRKMTYELTDSMAVCLSFLQANILYISATSASEINYTMQATQRQMHKKESVTYHVNVLTVNKT